MESNIELHLALMQTYQKLTDLLDLAHRKQKVLASGITPELVQQFNIRLDCVIQTLKALPTPNNCPHDDVQKIPASPYLQCLNCKELI